MKSITKRQQRNEKINYNRLVVAAEGIIAKKQARLQSGGSCFEMATIVEDIKFWEQRLNDLRDKAVNGG